MTKNLLILSFILVSSLSLLSAHIPCVCTRIYFPVCAFNGSHFNEFSNECLAHCVGYTMVYSGACKAKPLVTTAGCVANCTKKLDWVCAKIGNETVTSPSRCSAKCLGLEVFGNGTCDGKRVLGIASWMQDTANKISTAVTKAETAVKDAAAKTVDAIKDTAAKVDNAIKTAANKTEQAIIDAAQKVKDTFNKVVDMLKQRIRKIGEGFENCTCHVVDKLEAAIEAKVDEWEATAKAEAEALKNKTKAWWDQTRDGFIAAEDKIAGWFDRTAKDIANKTIIMWTRARDAIQREEDWFKKLIQCNNCTNEYKPVCIDTGKKETATMLNQCWANCGNLQIMYAGQCKNDVNGTGEALVVEHVQV